jgi:hypothetical protein
VNIRIHDFPPDIKPGTYLVEVTVVRPGTVEYKFIGPAPKQERHQLVRGLKESRYGFD